MKKNKPIAIAVFASVLLAGIFSFSVSKAEEMPEPVSLGEIVAVAEVNIFDAKIVSQEENRIKLSFDLSNGRSVQPDVRYAVRLIGIDDDNQAVADERIYAETFNLKENETVPREIEYAAPAYLKGNFQVWLMAQNQSGLDLALAQAGEIALAGTEGYVEIVPDSCYLRVEGEPEDKTYSLTQGVDVKSEEKLIAVCELSNRFGNSVEFTPVFKNYWRSTFGKPVESSGEPQAVLKLASGEKKPFEMVLPKAMAPQAYDAVLELQDKTGQTVSNRITFHYVLRGASATIQNLRLDKDYYQKGETAQASIYWTPAADNFYGARFTPTENSEISLVISIKNGSGVSCSDDFNRTADPNARISDYSLPITADCADPRIAVSLEDNQGNVLDRKEYALVSQNAPASPESGKEVPQAKSDKYDPVFLYLGILGAILAIAIMALVFRNKRSVSLIVFFILGAAFFMQGDEALAATYVVRSINTSHSDSVYTVNLNKSSFSPGENVIVYGTGSGGVCRNGDVFQYLSVTSTDGLNSVSKPIIDIYIDIGHRFVANGSITWGWTSNGWVNFPSSSAGGSRSVKLVGRGWGSSASFSLPYTIPIPPTCSLSFNPPGPLTAPANVGDSWSSTNATSASAVCTGPLNWSGTIPVSGSNANIGPLGAGTETCTMTVYGPGGTGTCRKSVVINAPCTLPWGGTTPSGTSVTAYRLPSVACGSVCSSVSQTRTCTNGVLSGTYTNRTCSVQTCAAPCALPWGGTTPSGSSVTAYNTTQACDCTTADQTRTCTNGTLSGTYTNKICLPIPSVPGSCGTADGQEFMSEPTSDLCSSGNPSAVSGTDDSWDWTCNGICSTTNVSCSADRSLDLNWKEVNPN